MASTTASKKGIIDFLWEWGESNGDWGKLLVHKIVTTETGLSPKDREEVFNYFLLSLALKTDLPPLTVAKPSYTPSTKKIDIVSLSDVKGVNKLAKGQSIEFGDNVTVIYGENGSGKTGYGRILKALGHSYEVGNLIYSDIYKANEQQTASIKYKVDGSESVFSWDGKSTNPDLQNISVFNNNCVQISLADGRGLLVSPIGFHLFNLVSEELGKLNTLFQETISKYPTTIDWINSLHLGTLQEQFITNLKGNSSIPKLEELSAFNDTHKQSLADSELLLKNLNKQLLEIELKNFRTQEEELSQVIAKIEKTKSNLNSANCLKLGALNSEIVQLESKTNTGLKEIAESNNILLYQSPEFQKFIKAADEYLKVLNQESYPNSGNDVCLYCNQELASEKSKALLTAYKQLLNDNTQELIRKAKGSKLELIKLLTSVDAQITLHQQTFGVDDQGKALQPKEITEYNKVISEKKAEIEKDSNLNAEFAFNYAACLELLQKKKADIATAIASKDAILQNIATKERELQNKIYELLDRRVLSSRIDQIKTIIRNKSIVSKLLGGKSSFSTNALSRKTSEAREQLLQQDFNLIFESELKNFRKSNIKIQINFGTDKGKSKMQQRLNSNYILSEILSEGEQKAIALAEFLTELQIDNSKAPIIFDDPVNSLDHHIIDDVSRRVLNLSKTRQVVIFTHSVLLFNSLLYFSRISTFTGVKCKFYDIKSEFGQTGIISAAEEEINKVKSYQNSINVLLNNTPKGRSEVDIASDCYGYLRSAIELCVEQHILKGTVKRYQKNVALTQFLKVDGLLLNKHKDALNELFERCCCYLKGHSNPEEVITNPTLSEFRSDYAIFADINKQFEN